jgi:hypothetical protein
MTHSGRLVAPAYAALSNYPNEAPSLEDIALSTSRMPRFAGHTTHWWTVLDHHLYVVHLARTLGKITDPRPLLALALHDAHESLTGDIPTDVKSDGMRAAQYAMDGAIMLEHYPGGFAAFNQWREIVKDFDKRALLAEALIIGPPRFGQLPPEEFERLLGGQPGLRDTAELTVLLMGEKVSRPGQLWRNGDAPNVKQYIRLVRSLQKQARKLIPVVPAMED